MRDGRRVDLLRLDPPLIGSFYTSRNEDRVLVKLSGVPSFLTKALITIEDRDFYSHHGITLRGIARALWANIRAGRTVQGGSTLTQQLVKNYFLSNERSLSRKVNEVIMALLLELHYSKDDIVESYMNEVYLGQDGKRAIHGFGLASHFYFQRPLKKLGIDQLARLVGLVKGPSYYDPRRHPDRALRRRNLVLSEMARRGLIPKSVARRASRRRLGVVPYRRSSLARYPAFMDLVRRQLRRDYREDDLTSEGLRIFTTLDPHIQETAERELSLRIGALERGYRLPRGKLQGAVVITRTGNAEVLAVVGDRRVRYAGFNRALDAVRQVGSLIKPAVYLTALTASKGFTLATLISDDPVRIKTPKGDIWQPGNYDHRNHGDVPLYLSLVHSYNVSTVRLGMELGAEAVISTLRKLGIRRYVPAYPSLFLGVARLSPIEVTQMYQTLAGGGFRTPVRSIRAVLDKYSKPLSRYPLTVEKVFDPVPVYMIVRTMQEVVRQGTAKSANAIIGKPLNAAGKTGTTDDLRDSWFAGFSGNYLAVVWLGADDNSSTRLTGATGAMRIWAHIMRETGARPLRLTPPPGVREAWIDPVTGKLTDSGCETATRLPFIKGTEPKVSVKCRSRSGKWFRRLFGL
jgi:penicillin-binding protein 1B